MKFGFVNISKMDLTINLLPSNFILEKKVMKKIKNLLVLFFENLILIPYICGSKLRI